MLVKGLEGASADELETIETKLAAIGKRIQEHRKATGISQEKLAETMNVSVNTIKYIEQGRRIPSLPMLLRLLFHLDLDFVIKK